MAGNLHSTVTKVTAGGKNVGSHGSLTFSLSYDAPSMSQMTPPNREIASAQSMNMTGFGFRQTEYSMRSRPHTSDAEASLWRVGVGAGCTTCEFVTMPLIQMWGTRLPQPPSQSWAEISEKLLRADQHMWAILCAPLSISSHSPPLSALSNLVLGLLLQLLCKLTSSRVQSLSSFPIMLLS